MCCLEDGLNYVNHSSHQNIKMIMPEGKGVEHSYVYAVRNIEAGEELHGDYEKDIPYP